MSRRRRSARSASVSALAESWLHHLSATGLAPATLLAYRQDLAGVSRRLARAGQVDELRLEHLTKGALRDAFSSWAGDHSPASVRRAHSSWSGFFAFLVADDRCEGNPMAAVLKPRAPEHALRAIRDPDAAARLLATAAKPDPRGRNAWPERDLALVATFCVTGIRAAEAVALDVSSFGGPVGRRHLSVAGPNGNVRSIPVDQSLERVLRRFLSTRAERFPSHEIDGPGVALFVDVRGHRLTTDQTKYLVERLYVRAGLRDRVPPGALVQALRHTFALSAARAGADIVGLQALLGHSSLETTRRYLDIAADDLRHLVDGHPGQAALRRHLRQQAAESDGARRTGR